MTTIIHSNGGGQTLPIEALFDRLLTDTLDRKFEAYGGFIESGADIERIYGKGYVCFFGNFFTYSHVFRIATNDAELIRELTAAIEINQTKTSYIEQCPPFEKELFRLEVHQFSLTQGEVSLFYDGELLGRFGDKYELQANGQWRGLREKHWIDIAQKIRREQHEASVRQQRAA